MNPPSAPREANGIIVIAAKIIAGKLIVSSVFASTRTPSTKPIMLKYIPITVRSRN